MGLLEEGLFEKISSYDNLSLWKIRLIIARDQNISPRLFVLSNIATGNLRNYLRAYPHRRIENEYYRRQD